MSLTKYEKPNITTDFSSTPTWLYVIIVAVLYVFGLYSVIDYVLDPKNADTLEAITDGLAVYLPVSLPFLPFIIIFGVLFVLLTAILAYVLVWIISKVAFEVTVVVVILFPIILIVLGLLIASSGLLLSADDASTAGILGILLAGFGVLLLAFAIWKFTMIKRSGQFVEFSAQLVLDEKAVLGMPILLGVYSIVTGFFMLFGFLKIYGLFAIKNTSGESELSVIGLVFAILFEYLYLIVYLGIYYSLSAGVISYASDWYRGLDPDLNSAMKDVRQIFPVILKFAFVMATVKLIMQIVTAAGSQNAQGGRDGRGGGGAMVAAAIAGIFISIIGAIWMFLNYFTLISMVQNKKGLKDSIKDSAKTTWNSLLDVLVGETGFGLTMFIFAIVNSLLWIVTGFSIGVIAFPNGIETAGISQLVTGVIFAFVFVILGTLPYTMVSMPMKVAFRTFIYSYAVDVKDGFDKPSRLPAEFRDEFKTLASHERKRHMRDPTEYF